MSKDIKSDEHDDSILLDTNNNDKTCKVMDINYLSMSKSLTALQLQQLEQQQQYQLRRISEQSATNRFGQAVSFEMNFRSKEPSVIDKYDAMKSAYESNIEPDHYLKSDKYPLTVKYTNNAPGRTILIMKNKNKNCSVKQHHHHHPLVLKKKKSFLGISNEIRFNKISNSKSQLKFINSFTGFNMPTPSLDNYNKSFRNRFKIIKKSGLNSYKYQKTLLLNNAKTFPKERENSFQKKILLTGSMGSSNRPSPVLNKLKFKSSGSSSKKFSSQVEKSKPMKKMERLGKEKEKSISIKDKIYLRKKLLNDKMIIEQFDDSKRILLNKINKELDSKKFTNDELLNKSIGNLLGSKSLYKTKSKTISITIKKSDPVLNKSGHTMAQLLNQRKISNEYDKKIVELETAKLFEKIYKLFEKLMINKYNQIMDKPNIQQTSKSNGNTSSAVTALSLFKSSNSSILSPTGPAAIKEQLNKKILPSMSPDLPEVKKEQKSRTRSSEARAARAVAIKATEDKKVTEKQLTNDDFEDLNDALGDLNTAINTLKDSYGSIIRSLANMQARRCKKALQNIIQNYNPNNVNKSENKIVEEMMKQYSKYTNLSTTSTTPSISKTQPIQVLTLNEIQNRALVIDYEEKYKVDKFLDPQQHDDIFQRLFKEIEEINIAFVQFGTFFDPEGYFQSDKYYKQNDFRLSVKQHQDFMKMFSKMNAAVGKVLKAYNTDLLDMFRIQSVT